MERKQTLGLNGTKKYFKEQTINCPVEKKREIYLKSYNAYLPKLETDPFSEAKIVVQNEIVTNPSKLEREKNFRTYEILCIGNNKRQSTQEHVNRNIPIKETGNDEFLRFIKNNDFTKKDPYDYFYVYTEHYGCIEDKIAPIIKKIFENMKTSGLTSIYGKEKFSMIKNKEYYDSLPDKTKANFSEIKGTPYYYRTTSRKCLFQCLSILLKRKLIPFYVYIKFYPSLEKRRIFQLRNQSITYQYDP